MPPDPDDLLRQSDVLVGAVAPTQADLRRAISTACYGVFHFCLTASADMVCGMTSRTAPGYSLVYRSIDHARLRNLCDQLRRTNPQGVAIVPAAGFGLIADFARVTVNLYEQRIRADYEPSLNFTANEAKVAISEARQAIAWFRSCDEEQRRDATLQAAIGIVEVIAALTRPARPRAAARRRRDPSGTARLRSRSDATAFAHGPPPCRACGSR